VLITGASGNLGAKAVVALRALPDVELVELGDADLSVYDATWAERFRGVDVVLHLAADPSPVAPWDSVISLNLDLSHNVLLAAQQQRVARFVFASSNWVLGGYRFTHDRLTPDTTPRPINAYGMSKLAIERAGAACARLGHMSFLALRIGWCQRGENRPGPHMAFGRWGQQLWLSNDDWAQVARLACTIPFDGFAIVNVMSDNDGSRWDLSETERVLGYRPTSHHTPRLSPVGRLTDAAARVQATILPSWNEAPLFGGRW